MRNLILHQIHVQNLLNNDSKIENLHPIGYWLDEFSKILVIIDSEFKILIFSYENSDPYSNFTLKRTIELEEVLSRNPQGIEILSYLMSFISETSEIDLDNSAIKILIYKNEDESLHMLLSSGIYINFDITTEKFIIDSFLPPSSDTKVLSAELSPNLENILIVASNFKIMLVNYEFEIIIDWKDLDDGDMSDISKDNFICKEASSSWRGDSSFFCVLYEINGGRKCIVRDNKFVIFKGPARADNKVVFSVAETPLKNLSNIVSWQPSGSLISFFQEGFVSEENTKISALERAGVIFSEKNCLRHGDFFLDPIANLNQYSVDKIKLSAKFLKWNMDLPLLIVYFDTLNLISIYYRSNYDWTLKYSYYLNPGEKLFSLKFSDVLSLRLYTLLTNGKFCITEFKLDYQNSLNNYNFSDNNGTISVLAGNKIKLTPLGSVNIPPPLCLETIKFNKNRTPPFILSYWRNCIFILSNNCIDLIKINHNDKKYTLVENIYSNDKNNFNSKHVKNFIFTTNENLSIGYFIINKIIENNDSIDELVILIFEINSESNNLKFLNLISLDTHKIDRCAGIFNSILSEELYDKNFYMSRDNIISTTDNPENLKINNNTFTNEEDDLFLNLVGVGSDKNKLNLLSNNVTNNLTSNISKYFYILNLNKNQKEKVFNKLTINEKNLNFEKTNIVTSLDVIKSHSVITTNNEEKIVYITKNNRLFINNTLLALDVTSFEYFKHFLIFTQTSNSPYNTLHIIDLNKKDYLNCSNNSNNNLNNVTVQEGLFVSNFNYKSFTIRTLERSALIVSVSKVNLILQMSRGNLETIYPRLLVLNLITELITIRRDYLKAFELVRKHKINTNFIYDVDPEGFLKNISLFVSQVEKSDWINLFLNGLENSICEEMMQLDSDLNSKEDFKKLFIYNKVNKICDELRKELVLVNKDNKYLTSILHTHTKKSPPEYLLALKSVQSLKIQEKNKLKLEELVSSGTKKTSQTHSNADKALEYLCWVVNAETLFDFALKTYDFELVIMVAKNTQKDPKEYLPYLKKLQDLHDVDPVLMKYQVNMDLKNFEDALIELSEGGAKYFEKCLELINKYELFEQSFSLFSKSDDEKLFCTIYKNFGDYLKNIKKNYLEAAWAYLRSQSFEDALKCFIESGCVNEAITIIKKHSSSLDLNIFEVLSEMVDVCTAAKKVSEIEKIYLYVHENESKLKSLSEDHYPLNFNNFLSKLMDALLRTKRWKSAYLFYNDLVISSVADNNVSSVLKEFNEGINLAANLQLNELKKNLTFYEEKYNRFLKVQHLKRTQPHLFMVDLAGNLNDNVSDSGSVISGISNFSNSKSKKSSMSKTSKSSKLTKKSKNKITKRTVKEGSPLEEEYLITILSELKIFDSDIESIRDLMRVLTFIKSCNTSDELKTTLNQYIETVNNGTKKLLTVAQQDFINTYPEIKDLFPSLNLPDSLLKEKSQGMKIFNTTSECGYKI